MAWHTAHQTEEDSICHPSDIEAWRHFDRTYPNFAEEPRNVRLGLCKDGFASHGQYDRTYLCWSIILTPYNLPPDDTRAFHPQHSRKECYFNCYRQFLLVDHTYRRNKKAFTKDRVKYTVARPRLTGEEIRNWVADFSPAVEQLLTLPSDHGSDNKWMKKTIFWDLPYWATHLIRHNLDVLLIEKNILQYIQHHDGHK
ncbi:UNVERIFIED_CONTAM: hypothetical protein Sradi_5064300 [Sesamum radiatum]|uniref:Uncharacterized protein n=1 Tax=Sesamum radiatum TaxID=300843 RepID=A0AAW2M0H0_SESRA